MSVVEKNCLLRYEIIILTMTKLYGYIDSMDILMHHANESTVCNYIQCMVLVMLWTQYAIDKQMKWLALKRAVGLRDLLHKSTLRYSPSKSVESSALSLQGVDYIHGGDSLSLGVLCVGDGVTDDILEEHLQDSTSLLVDQSGDTLDTTSAGQTPDGGLCDSLDVITKHLPVALGTSLSQSFTSFTTSRHDAKLSIQLANLLR